MVKGLSGILYFCKTEYPCEVLITKDGEIVLDGSLEDLYGLDDLEENPYKGFEIEDFFFDYNTGVLRIPLVPERV